MSKKVLIAIFIFLLIFFYMVFHDTHTVTDFPTRSGPIVAFGDSLTEGYGTTKGHNYVDILAQRIGEEIINMGVSGNTTTDALLRMDELVAQEPRLVILLLGGNDTLRQMPAELTEQNLRDIIETLHDEGTAVLLVGVSGGFANAQRYADMFEELADEYELAFVPNILKGLIGRSEYMYDAIHPNDTGHVKMADRIEPELRMLIEK